MRVGQRGQDDPFCNLRAVDARRGGQRDRGFCIDWSIGDVVRACGEKMDELEIWAGFWAGRKGGKRSEDGCVLVDFCRKGLAISSRALQLGIGRRQNGYHSNLRVSLPFQPTACS